MAGSGFIADIILYPGNCNDTPMLANYLDERLEHGMGVSGQNWIMDKGFPNVELARWPKRI
jgi:hypothetical protein